MSMIATLPLATDSTVLATSLPSIENYLGRKYLVEDPTYGPRWLQLVKNTSASSIAAARAVVTEAGETVPQHVEIAPVDAQAERFQGVTLTAIGVGYVGWVVAPGGGDCLALAGTGGIAANLPIAIGGTAGAFKVAAARESYAQIAGGAAGDHTVSAIKAEDRLISVLEEDGTSGKVTDLTSEFSVTADATINNDGGTATTGDALLVRWEKAAGGTVGTGMAAITATNTGRISLK